MPSSPTPYAPPSSPHPYAPPGTRPPHLDAFATSDKHRQQVLGGVGYDTPRYRNDKVAVASMVLGIIGVVVPGVCLLAVAFGHLGLRRLQTSYEGGRGLAVAGLTMGYAMTAIWLAIAFLTVAGDTLL